MDYDKKALQLSENNGGKIEINSKVPIKNMDDLAVAYTPGVAEVSREIHRDKENVYKYTSKKNMVAIVTDGSAVLGLGDIGPEAAIPVMEGKAALFKQFADVDAIPISVNTKDVDEIVSIVENISPSFGGINLEDISAPRCFEIEARLKEKLDIPVFHDDQHGTAIVTLAAIINALKLVDKKIKNTKIVVNGGGAAGIAIAKLLHATDAGEILLVDIDGIISSNNPDLEERFEEIASLTNQKQTQGTLQNALEDADVFVGVSAPNVLDKEWISKMKDQPIIFAMANPTPEIMPDVALEAGAYIVGTGRSDFPNQINNVLAFPGIFRGALDSRAPEITQEMMIAAAYGIASAVPTEELAPDNIIPNVFAPDISEVVAKNVRKASNH